MNRGISCHPFFIAFLPRFAVRGSREQKIISNYRWVDSFLKQSKALHRRSELQRRCEDISCLTESFPKHYKIKILRFTFHLLFYGGLCGVQKLILITISEKFSPFYKRIIRGYHHSSGKRFVSHFHLEFLYKSVWIFCGYVLPVSQCTLSSRSAEIFFLLCFGSLSLCNTNNITKLINIHLHYTSGN